MFLLFRFCCHRTRKPSPYLRKSPLPSIWRHERHPFRTPHPNQALTSPSFPSRGRNMTVAGPLLLCWQTYLSPRIPYGPRLVSRLRPLPERRPYLLAGAVPWNRPNFCTARTLPPDFICTFLRAPIRPATVNSRYCDTPLPHPRSLSSHQQSEESARSYTRALFFRGWQIPSLNVTLRYFCKTFCIKVGENDGCSVAV